MINLKNRVTFFAIVSLIVVSLFFYNSYRPKGVKVTSPPTKIEKVDKVEITPALKVTPEESTNLGKFTIEKTNQPATGKNSRINYVILHYTVIDDEASLRVLTTKNVSAHYLVTTKEQDPIYSLVPDYERAWHAGASAFGGRSNLNDTSIGIEIVNPGLMDKKVKTDRVTAPFPPKEYYVPFNESQVEKIAFLLKDLIEKYNVPPQHIIGHSDIAPGRKPDPGPQFPWKRLHDEYGIGAWYDQADYDSYSNNKSLYFSQSISDIKKEFVRYGYSIKDMGNQWDDESRQVIQAFQSHFQPDHITGKMDISTFAIIKSLNKKYNNS